MRALSFLLYHFQINPRKSDGVHWHLVRCIGGQIIAGAFVSLRFRRGNRTTHTVCYLLRIIPCTIYLMLVFQCRSMTPNLIPPAVSLLSIISYLEIAKMVLIVGLVANVTLLVTSAVTGTTLVPGNRIGNCLYQMDTIASICIGCAWLTFPKWLLHKQVMVSLDESHELCGRIMGGLFVTSYIASAHALHWTSNADKLVTVDGRVVCCLCILSAQVWSQIAYTDSWSGGHWIGITLFSTWTLSSIVYRLTLYFTSKPKSKNT
uniref:G protein-coupled receptor n=1 Tax=Angiostrongylus cantonensis TaxID=6313 RepID=A0A0K0D6W1_ANGCA